MVEKENIKKAIELALEDKGKKKFVQSVEIIMNFRGVDFTKPVNRVNMDVVLPKGLACKTPKIVVFAEEKTAHEVKKYGVEVVVLDTEILNFTKDLKKLKLLAKDHVFLAEPKLMGKVAKEIGQFLGVRGKSPKPLIGNLKSVIEMSRKSIKIVSKGKYLPVLQAKIGTENMQTDDLVENAIAIIEKVTLKTGPHSLKNVYIKLSMGKSIKVGGKI